jgi:hypothetical protein
MEKSHINSDLTHLDYYKSEHRKEQLRIEFHLVEHCNLNCRGCSHYSPLAKDEFLDIAQFEKDTFRLSQLLGKRIASINLLGGEPLLHPDVAQFCRVARKYFPKAEINIVTNGILLKSMSNDFWDTCQECCIMLGLTKYPIKLNYSDIEKKAAINNVNLFDYHIVENFRKDVLDPDGKQIPNDSYKKCPLVAFGRLQIKKGKLFQCATAAYINHINDYFHMNFQITDKDYLDLYQKISEEKILQFIFNSFPFCRYCALKDWKFNDEWTTSKRVWSEWSN